MLDSERSAINEREANVKKYKILRCYRLGTYYEDHYFTSYKKTQNKYFSINMKDKKQFIPNRISPIQGALRLIAY